ncbi:MAG: outer membrane lipoprotein-sorting protein [Spirochaetaceae bacterium]|jgi:outer membrane lipoprotein-sorting protein|nr:outer membrane lipoprotein-sorting protein [Spirochaetaceae bacterium]
MTTRILLPLPFIAFIAAAAFAQTASPQDAEALIRASRSRIEADTTSTRARMVITGRDGSTTERLLDQYSKDGPSGERTVIVFQRPASVAGTRFLTMKNAGGADDQWIFLPSLGKVRRIAASEGSGSFMGTDFSYDDIASASRSADLDTHRVIREEALDGKACHVIESVPRDSGYQYSRMIQWLDRESGVLYKLELYNRRNVLVKVIEMGDFRDVQGRLTPHRTTVSTLAAGTSTALIMEIVKYDDPIPEGVFTTAYLETGRLR